MEVLHGDEFVDELAHEAAGIPQTDDGKLAMGLKVPTSVKVPVSYLDDLRKYKDIYNDIYKQISVCNKLYRYNSHIGNGVDILNDFAVTKVRPNSTGKKELDEILQYWFDTVNSDNTNTLPGIYPITQEMGLEWFTSGNAFPYEKWKNVEYKNGNIKLPDIYMLNPEAIEIPAGPIAFGQEVIYLKNDSALLGKILSDGRNDPEAALLKQAIPRSILQSIKDSGSTWTQSIRLNPKYIKHLKRKAKNYQAWGVPYLTRCFSAASILERLRELDESITSGLINLVTIFKVGTKEYPASPARLQKFASLLRNPKATTTLVWAHDIEMLQVGPDGKVLAFKDKYKDAKEDLLVALGIPPVLMSNPQSGDAWVSILALVERLSDWRKVVSLWLEGVCNKIAEYNGYEDIKVTVKWERMNLTNETEVKNLILAFYDRGLLSAHTSLKEANYDYEHEIKNKTDEEKDADKLMPPNLPFSGGKETEKTKPTDNSIKSRGVETKKSITKTDQTVDMKTQKKIKTPKA